MKNRETEQKENEIMLLIGNLNSCEQRLSKRAHMLPASKLRQAKTKDLQSEKRREKKRLKRSQDQGTRNEIQAIMSSMPNLKRELLEKKSSFLP